MAVSFSLLINETKEQSVKKLDNFYTKISLCS